MTGQTPNPSSGRLQEYDTAQPPNPFNHPNVPFSANGAAGRNNKGSGERKLSWNISSPGLSLACLMTLTSSLGFSNMEELF